MRFPRQRPSTSVMIRVFIPDNSVTTGAGLTGLTSASTNLTIAFIRELDGSATTYTGANIEAQTTIGTYEAPTSSSKVRFKAVAATAMPGLYELQFHDSATAFGAGDTSQNIIINVYEATTTALKIGPNACLIPLVPWNYQDGVRMGLTALPNAAAEAAGGLYTRGSGVGQINQDANGRVDTNTKTWIGGTIPAVNVTGVPIVDLKYILGTVLTETAGLLAAGFKKFFNVATPTGTLNSLPDAVAGATGGVFIAGTNAATTVTTALTTTFTGNLTGSVGSVSGLTASDVGAIKTKTDFLPSATAGTADGVFIAGTNAATTITTGLTTTFTGNLTGSVGSVSGLTASDVGSIKAKTDNLPAAPAAVSDIPTAIQNADALLDRNMATGADNGSTTVRTARQALRFLRNKWAISAGTLTVYKEDDASSSWTSAVSTDVAAEPVIGNDPAGP